MTWQEIVAAKDDYVGGTLHERVYGEIVSTPVRDVTLTNGIFEVAGDTNTCAVNVAYGYLQEEPGGFRFGTGYGPHATVQRRTSTEDSGGAQA